MGTDLGYMLLIGFGAMKLTEFYKEITRRVGLHQVGWWKSLVNFVCCAALACLVVHRDVRTTVLIAVAASGVAALSHATDTVLRIHRDEMITKVMDKNRVRRR